jgi:hypothetical protein
MTPPIVGPTSREAFEANDASAFAATRSSFGTRRGSIAPSAGRRNRATNDSVNATRYTIHTSSADRTSASGRIANVRMRFAMTIVRLRSHRSTKTPATDPNTICGTSSATNIALVASVEPVSWNT